MLKPVNPKPKTKTKKKKLQPKLMQKVNKKSSKNRMMYAGGGYSEKRMAYGEGGVVQYADIKDKVKKCDAKAGMNTMKYKYES